MLAYHLYLAMSSEEFNKNFNKLQSVYILRAKCLSLLQFEVFGGIHTHIFDGI